jgi:bacterioferritin-associated ferredoxin
VYVCSCKAVTDRTVVTTIEGGADTVEEVGLRCGAGTRCGGCWPTLDELIDRHAPLATRPQRA